MAEHLKTLEFNGMIVSVPQGACRKTAEILVDEYMVRLESCSKTFPDAEAN